jgi:hypothetical protein
MVSRGESHQKSIWDTSCCGGLGTWTHHSASIRTPRTAPSSNAAGLPTSNRAEVVEAYIERNTIRPRTIRADSPDCPRGYSSETVSAASTHCQQTGVRPPFSAWLQGDPGMKRLFKKCSRARRREATISEVWLAVKPFQTLAERRQHFLYASDK